MGLMRTDAPEQNLTDSIGGLLTVFVPAWWQRELESRARPVIGRNPHFSAMRFDDRAADR
jgi:hypothetical protein